MLVAVDRIYGNEDGRGPPMGEEHKLGRERRQILQT